MGLHNRTKLGWPLDSVIHELEERSGVAYNTIWRLENGKTGAQPRTIRKLAVALGVEPEELVVVGGSDG